MGALWLLAAACLATAATAVSVQPPPTTWQPGDVLAHEYIVKFAQYHAAADRRVALRALLPERGWRVLPRVNAASALPSDFEVVACDPGQCTALVAALQHAPGIASVTPQRRWLGRRPLQV